MTTFILTSGSYVEQSLAAGEMGIVGANAVIVADSAPGIDIVGSNGGSHTTVNVQGAILSTFQEAIEVTNTNLRLLVGVYGNLNAGSQGGVSYSAVTMSGGAGLSEIDNLGVIQAHSFAIYFSTSEAFAALDLFNSGTILGNSAAVQLISGDTLHIMNTGMILGDINGINSTMAGDARIENTGLIQGVTEDAIFTWSGNDQIVNRGDLFGDVRTSGGNDVLDNRYGVVEGDVDMGSGNDVLANRVGLINGDVFLGAGADIYDGRGGEVARTVFGDAGADLFLGNVAEVDIFNGGADVDTLDFRVQGAVGVALDGAFASTGAAQGDTYSAIENVFGSDTGSDVIRGDGAVNALFGFGGNDNLNGMAGDDVIRGGLGLDSLVGGLGNDTFRYDTLAEGGDIIVDFASVLGHDDRFLLSAAGFGGGLVAGALAANLFQSRVDNVAQDADDRFIFRTTDATVWFDADGSGAGAAVLLADLQTGALVTAADFFLF